MRPWLAPAWQPPAHEYGRSQAAAWVGRQAALAAVPMAHFEYRERLELPAQWLPQGRPDLGAAPGWQGGELPESKYQSYQHDLLVASYHPSHRAKWTAHEVLHSLQGFAWRPDATPFFHAIAAWQAEILPVALWYFFDEAGLRRCPEHQGLGPLWGHFCVPCEEAAQRAPGLASGRWRQRGLDFIEGQLEAVRRSVAAGRMQPRRYVTIDLASDGLAYAAAHGKRLNSRCFAELMERFPATCDSIEAYEARIVMLTEALLHDRDLPPLLDGARAAAHDIAWRLLTLRAQAEGPVADALLALVDQLADDLDLARCVEGYEALYEEWVLEEPKRVFAVGYPLSDRYGLSAAQILDGLRSAVGQTTARMPDGMLERFIAGETLQRRHIGERLAAFLQRSGERSLADLARLETAIAKPPAADLEALTLAPGGGTGPWRIGRGHHLIRSRFNLLAAMDGGDLEHGTTALLVVRRADAAVELLELDDDAASWLEAIAAGGDDAARPSDEVIEALLALGVIVAAEQRV